MLKVVSKTKDEFKYQFLKGIAYEDLELLLEELMVWGNWSKETCEKLVRGREFFPTTKRYDNTYGYIKEENKVQ